MAEKVPYHTICSCNPANGGSGICGCIMGNKLVDPDFRSNMRQSIFTHISDEWWQRPYIQYERPVTENPKLVTFLESRITDCESAISISDNPTYWQGKIAAYKEILVELNQNIK
jgi:hypothetical protein